MRIVLADNSALLREGLVRLLGEAGQEVVAAVGNAPDALAATLDHTPDVLITDVRMPPTGTDDGLRAATAARAALPHLGVLVLSQEADGAYASELLAAPGDGGSGYLLKDRVQDMDTLVSALNRIADGGTVVDPEVIAQLLVRRQTRDTAPSDGPAPKRSPRGRTKEPPQAKPLSSMPGQLTGIGSLTPREREVLALMAEGRTNVAISDRLFITGGAVEKHISSIFSKLELAPSEQDHRRVLAGLAYHGAGRPPGNLSARRVTFRPDS
jgi:DNA-binding NarL/FixJ family response regulator